MQYMLLLYSAPETGPQTPEEHMAIMPQWFAYTEEMASAGVLVGGEPLQERETATTVRVRDGKTTTTDGPFAETKEVLGGYYLIDTETIEEAQSWAAKCPLAPWGSVEIRPLMLLPDAPS